MRPPSTATLSHLRASLTSGATTRPLHRPAPCLSCTHYIPSPTPSRRNHTQPPPSTHYHFFPNSLPSGPPPQGRFAIDLSSLKKEFLQLQARAHPDRHPPENKNKAQALSARINEAYKTLQNPLLRAQYLLSLRGIDIHEDETAKVDDAELLMEVLEVRERIEEAESEEELVEMKDVNEKRIEESVRVLEEAFEGDDVEGATTEAVRLRYWVNIKESLDGWEKGKPVVLNH
ncbi:Co-chaperone Hsc20 [Polyplosphaeria fusca]|uniref:Co-chaperone Hsc20 n=1 Tax=Polyplosphaeria fusca TaxID=682080 RepID=A0A9P4UXP8_9PLEO|nr:Co-chaperone Hsc20 [Polyplosphaeria fusca]